jgi:hypothetical protein
MTLRPQCFRRIEEAVVADRYTLEIDVAEVFPPDGAPGHPVI